MFNKIEAKNFRAFKEIKVEPLSRINIFAGLNGCGKTSILEIPFLLSNGTNASLALSLYNFRGESIINPDFDRYFKGIFPELDTNKNVILESVGDFKKKKGILNRKLTISKLSKTDSTIDDSGAVNGLDFKFIGPRGKGNGKVQWKKITTSIGANGQPKVGTTLDTKRDKSQDNFTCYFYTPYYRELWIQAHKLLTDLTKKK